MQETAEEKSLSEKSKSKNKKKWLYIPVAMLLVAIAVGLVLFLQKSDSPVPKNIQKSVNFALYYPSTLPSGYTLDKGSVKSENQIVFYSLDNDGKKISISEQAAPANPPDFENIQKGNTSFKILNAAGGRAIYGVSQNLPAAIFLTNTTLINISGDKNVPLDTIVKTTQQMSPLP
jgi:hypothetical protein